MRLTAWVVLVALGIPQAAWGALPTSGSALRQRSDTAGLEEALQAYAPPTAPTKIAEVVGGDRVAQVQVARRVAGQLVALGVLDLTQPAAPLTAPTPVHGVRRAGPEVRNATQVQQWVTQGLQLLRDPQLAPVVAPILEQVQRQSPQLTMEYLADHANTLNWLPGEDGRIQLDVTIAQELAGDTRNEEGLKALYALILFHAFARQAERDEKEAWYLVLALYERLSQAQQEALGRVLDSEYVDHGNTFLFFLKTATDAALARLDDITTFAGIPTSVLKTVRDWKRLKEWARTYPEARARLDALDKFIQDSPEHARRLSALMGMTQEAREQALEPLLQHRERMVSWLMGQVQFDLPYDRAEFRKALTEANLDRRRELTFRVIKRYNRQVEQANARRTGKTVRDKGMYLVGGRESRAFHNQASGFANSFYVLRSKDLVDAVIALDQVMGAEAYSKALDRMAKRTDDLAPLAQALKDRLVLLETSMNRIRQLVLGPEKMQSLIQYHAAIQQLRDMMTVYQNESNALLDRYEDRINKAGRGFAAVDMKPVAGLVADFIGRHGAVKAALDQVTLTLQKTSLIPAAFSILLQRPSRSGSINFSANELAEKPEQEEALRELDREGGGRRQMSPDYSWVAEVTDLIEAAPLFIHERTIEVDGQIVTVFEVDQEALEETIRQMADYWARNIQKTMDSEHVALAREFVVAADAVLWELAQRRIQARMAEDPTAELRLIEEGVYLEILQEARDRDRLAPQVAIVAAELSLRFQDKDFVESVEKHVEDNWQRHRYIDRIQAVKEVLMGPAADRVAYPSWASRFVEPIRRRLTQKRMTEKQEALLAEMERLAPIVFELRRRMPAFHMLTTESPGLVEGFIQFVLEQEMTAGNVCRALKLEWTETDARGREVTKGRVGELMAEYDTMFTIVADHVIREFGYSEVVRQHEEAGMSHARALQQVLDDYQPIWDEVSRLAVLCEVEEAKARAQRERLPRTVEAKVRLMLQRVEAQVDRVVNAPPDDTQAFRNRQALRDRAHEITWQRNEPDLWRPVQQIMQQESVSQEEAVRRAVDRDSSGYYAQERDAFMRWYAREQVFEQARQAHPELELDDRQGRWIREHTRLARTTARLQAIEEAQADHLMMDPRYYFGSGAVFEDKTGKFIVTGRRKRYHLIYAPSRVNLGRGELESVREWPQWVGVTDPLAAEHARRVYELINYNVVIRTIKEAENFKVSENETTALIRAIKNAQAYFVEGLGVGNMADLTYQMNMRGGWRMAWVKGGESTQHGSTRGYCIPKDILFKRFFNALKNRVKLGQIGIGAHLHPGLIRMVTDLQRARQDFDTAGEWEVWAAEDLLNNPERFRSYFETPALAEEAARTIPSLLRQYLEVTGGIITFHLTKLLELLGDVGVPSPILAHGRDLARFLWSDWAGEKVTLGGEQVNRSTIFHQAESLYRLIMASYELNSHLYSEEERKQFEEIVIQMFGPYKGDPDAATPPDTRYSAAARLLLILADKGKELAKNLDLPGQIIWQANWYGFHPEITDPEIHKKDDRLIVSHARVVRDLARRFLEISDEDLEATEGFKRAYASLLKRRGLPHAEFREEVEKLFDRVAAETCLALERAGDPRIAELRKQFYGPGLRPLGPVNIYVVPGVAPRDVMTAVSEVGSLVMDTADKVERWLWSLGMTSAQMAANAQVNRPLKDWVPLSEELAPEQMEWLTQRFGAELHALEPRLKGLYDNFVLSLEGADIVVFITVHPELLALAPTELRDYMRRGNPRTLGAIEGSSGQGRPWPWAEQEILEWYGAGRSIDKDGELILALDEHGEVVIDRAYVDRRSQAGRRFVFSALGMAEQTYQSVLGTNLRDEEERQEYRAAEIYAAMKRVADADESELPMAMDALRFVMRRQLPPRQMADELTLFREYANRRRDERMDKIRDYNILHALDDLARGVDTPLGIPLHRFNVGHWAAIGGRFLIGGMPKWYQDKVYGVFAKAQERLQAHAGVREAALAAAGMEEAALGPKMQPTGAVLNTLAASQVPLEVMRARETKGEMFSVKASAQIRQAAVIARKALALAGERAAALRTRERDFGEVVRAGRDADQDPYEMAHQAFRQMERLRDDGRSSKTHQQIGRIMGWTVIALRQAIQEFVIDAQERDRMLKKVDDLTQGRQVDLAVWRAFGGTYEDPGILARLFQLAGPAGREQVARVAELATMTLALEKLAPFLTLPLQDVDEPELWRTLSEFMAETIDDHFYEYNPWVYDPKRGAAFAGSGFAGFYDDLGILRPERAEELYQVAWTHHRALYPFLRRLILEKTSLRTMDGPDQDLLLGKVELGRDAAHDQLTVRGIGAEAPGRWELLWRAYNQLRDLAFIRNDGFDTPVVFGEFDPNAPDILDAAYRVNATILSPWGRTHYSRIPMAAQALGENIFMTRWGEIVTPAGATGPVFQITEAQFWLSEAQYRQALIEFKGMTERQADEQIQRDWSSKRLTPKGIRVAARFQRHGKILPVIVGAVVPIHHHPLESALGRAGYVTTDKSMDEFRTLFTITYNKSLYPEIFTQDTGVFLPPEIDWWQSETRRYVARAMVRPRDAEARLEALRARLRKTPTPALHKQAQALEQELVQLRETLQERQRRAKAAIARRLKPFAREHQRIVVKGAAESGARNFQRFDIAHDGQWDQAVFDAAVDFIYKVSQGQNVTIQKALITTPLAWMSAKAVEAFVRRQIADWGIPANLRTDPKSWVYGSLRVILSAGMPPPEALFHSDHEALFDPANWDASHWITLNSLQVATNVGRQGTLERLTLDMVHPAFREMFMRDYVATARQAMVAMARYARRHWHEVIVPAYRSEHGHDPEEFDATGVPHWWPRYLMWDLLPEPIVEVEGSKVDHPEIVDVDPGDPTMDGGRQPRLFVRHPRTGEVVEAKIVGFKFWVLEPNVGIGLWDRYWLREKARQERLAKAQGFEGWEARVDWGPIGASDEIVFGNFTEAGAAFLTAQLGRQVRRRQEPPVPASILAQVAGGPLPAQVAARSPVVVAMQLLADEEVETVGQDTLGRYLAAYLAARVAQDAGVSMEELRSRVAEDPGLAGDGLTQIETWLDESGLPAMLVADARVKISSRTIQQCLADPTYRQRVAELAVERLVGEALRPIDLLPQALTREEIRRLLPQGDTYAVVFGKRTLMANNLYGVVASASDQPINVIGLHPDWIKEGRIERFVVYDRANRRFVECACQQPILVSELSAHGRAPRAQIIELPRQEEPKAHQALTATLWAAGFQVVNPAGVAQQVADDKGRFTALTLATGRIPPGEVIATSVPEQKLAVRLGEILKGLLGRRKEINVVVQPAAGTTEAFGVEPFTVTKEMVARLLAGRAEDPIVQHVTALHKHGFDILVRQAVGNVSYQGRAAVIRMHVAGDSVSGYGIAAPRGERIASFGRAGGAISLQELLRGLEINGMPVGLTPEEYAQIEAAARAALQAANRGVPPREQLQFAGVDLVLEITRDGKLIVWVLEVNARPGGLFHASQIAFYEADVTPPPMGAVYDGAVPPRPFDIQAVGVLAGPAFWQQGLGYQTAATAAGMEEQQTAAHTLAEWRRIIASEEGRLGIIIGPGMAPEVLPKLAGLEEPPSVAVVVADDVEGLEVELWRDHSGFAGELQVVNLANAVDEPGTIIARLKAGLEDRGLSVFIVRSSRELPALQQQLDQLRRTVAEIAA